MDTATDLSTMRSALAEFFHGLQISLLQLLGMMIGAGASFSITLDRFGYSLERLRDESLSTGILIGLYTVAIALIGTWTSLGLLGRWAGRTGGRPLRVLVQIAGIVIAAWMTLPGAFAATLVIMKWYGDYLEEQNKSTELNRASTDTTE